MRSFAAAPARSITIDQAAATYTAHQLEKVLGVRAATLRQWVRRGHVRKYGRDAYDGDDVIARWSAAAGDYDDPEDERSNP